MSSTASCKFRVCISEVSLHNSEGILGDTIYTLNPSLCGQIHSWYSFTEHFSALTLQAQKNLLLDGFIPGMYFNTRIKIR